MTPQQLLSAWRQHFGHQPTPEQTRAIEVVAQFIGSPNAQSVMILNGAAGTGKTTLAAALVSTLAAMGQRLVLLAPTGRAAKVLALYARQPAFTIHRRIYRQRVAGDWGSAFMLNDNLHHHTLFLVDEASMISAGSGEGPFGSGCLLDDLLHYVYQGQDCRLLLIGDQAQLPPVGEEQSPALSAQVLQARGMQVFSATLTEVLRQSRQSGILCNATRIRQQGEADSAGGGITLPRLLFRGFADIAVVTGAELIEQLATSYSRVGLDETMVVTRSNKRANIYNQGIRNKVLDREDELCRGDQLMIVKNNYFWTAATEAEGQGKIAFLANGDRCVVQRVRRVHQLYGFRFAEVALLLPDYDDLELTVTALLDTLQAEAPALTAEQQEQLYQQVMADYADLPLKGERLKAMRSDAHYQALQVKYGYAVTCHKAQGGQWAHVYIDQGYMTDDMLTPDYYHWLYTALTRATEKVFMVNWPASQTEE